MRSKGLYSKLLQSITEQLFIISKRFVNINFKARVIKAALMILLYIDYNSIVVLHILLFSIMLSLLYLYIIIHFIIIIIFILLSFIYIYFYYFSFSIQRINVDKRVDVNVFIPERGGSPSSLPFAEVGIFFSGGSPWIFLHLLLLW